MTQDLKTEGRLTRVIDLKIPLVWLLTISASLAWVLVSMWFTLNQLVVLVADLQVSVKAGSNNYSILASEQALVNYRLTFVEAQINSGTKK